MSIPHISADDDNSIGRRRYGVPALNGQLPYPWLPAKKETEEVKLPRVTNTEGVVIDLRRRWSMMKGDGKTGERGSRERSPFDDATRAWRNDMDQLTAQQSGSAAAKNDFGIKALDEEEEPEEDVETGRYRTYFRRPESRRKQFPGHWQNSDANSTDDEAGSDEHEG
jgi:hypothetical protein